MEGIDVDMSKEEGEQADTAAALRQAMLEDLQNKGQIFYKQHGVLSHDVVAIRIQEATDRVDAARTTCGFV